MNCITLDGNRVDKKGAITGGFMGEAKTTRLAAAQAIHNARTALEKSEQEAKELKESLERQDAVVTRVVSDHQKLTSEKTHLRTIHTSLLDDIKKLKTDIDVATTTITRVEKLINSIKTTISASETQLSSLQEELESPFDEELASQEQQELDDLQAQIDTLKDELLDLSSTRNGIEEEKNHLDTLLHSNLYRRQTELTTSVSSQQLDEYKDTLEQEQQQLTTVNEQVKELDISMKEIDNNIDQLKEQQRKVQIELEDVKQKHTKEKHNLANQQKDNGKR